MMQSLITIAGGLLIPVGVPLLLVGWLWFGRFASLVDWLAGCTGALLAFALLFIISRWDVVGVTGRYGLIGAGLLAALSVVRMRNRPLTVRRTLRHWLRFLVTTALPLLVLAGIGAWAVRGMAPPQTPAPMNAPLHDGTYYVLHGGATSLLNYHGAFDPSHRFALDIVALNERGRRANGIYPSDLDAYVIYGATAYSPVSGTVTDVETSRPDQPPPTRDRQHPLGNYVVLQHDTLATVLAHLQPGSVRVERGDTVEAGDPLGTVGNSGSTSEPHLHIHSVRYSGAARPTPDRMARHGAPVPLQIGGRFLIRNNRFP